MEVGEYFQFLESIEIPIGRFQFLPIKSGEVYKVAGMHEDNYRLIGNGTVIEVPKSTKHQKVRPVSYWEPVSS